MTKNEAKGIIEETFSSEFNEKKFQNFIVNLLKKYTPVEKSPFIKDSFKSFVLKYKVTGYFEDNEGNKIDILEVALNKSSTLERARTAQRNFVAEYLNTNNKDAALVAFVSPKNKDWRLSLVKLENSLEVVDDKLKTREEITPAKRWSFLVGENEGSHTAEKAFDIEKVTKEFFDKYKELYFQLNGHIEALLEKDKAIKKDFEEKEISTVDFAKKTLGQIVFLYFLQKKGWFGVAPDKKWGDGPKKFIRELFERREKYGKNFFNDILEPLFYEALAQDRGAESIYPRLNNCRMPFLNGGLFEPMNGYMWETTDIIIPDELFSNTNKTKEGDTGDGILDIFDRYNFTVNENEPLEKEVAVDPEMLGKVFENLLDIKDRKSKGSFYTPREIVHYMCQESLINYLETGTKKEIPREDLEIFIHTGDRIIENDKTAIEREEKREARGVKYTDKTYPLLLPKSIRTKSEELDQLLKDIKVADPAVGSGAFPLGMINEIVRARKVLNIYLKKEISDYALKKYTITHSIYGVDIDPGAVEIAKLRLWLALVVDEQTPHPLPNLEHKIMQGNSLISEYEGIKLFDENIFEKEENKEDIQKALGLGKSSSELKMEDLRQKTELFINESQRSKKQKLKEDIDNLKWELIETTLAEQGKLDKLEDIKEYRKSNTKPFFIWKLEFSDVFKEKGGFDVVIGNPPYVSIRKIDKDIKETYKKSFYSASGQYDLYVLFIEKSLFLTREKGLVSFITSNKFLISNYGKKLRKMITEKSCLIDFVDYSKDNIFEEASVYPVVFLLKNIKCKVIDAQDDYNLLKVFGFDCFDSIIDKLDKIKTTLGDSCIIKEAIHTGNIRKKLIFTENNNNYHKLLRGKDCGRYSISWAGFFVNYDYVPKKELNEYANLIDKKYFEGEKIFLREIALSPTAVYDDEDYYSLNKAYVISAKKEKVNLKYINGILNSKLIAYFFDKKFGDIRVGGGYLQFKKQFTTQIPILFNESFQKDIVKLVDEILKIKKQNFQVSTKDLEKEIDQMVYKLYDLTEEEIKIIEDK